MTLGILLITPNHIPTGQGPHVTGLRSGKKGTGLTLSLDWSRMKVGVSSQSLFKALSVAGSEVHVYRKDPQKHPKGVLTSQ